MQLEDDQIEVFQGQAEHPAPTRPSRKCKKRLHPSSVESEDEQEKDRDFVLEA